MKNYWIGTGIALAGLLYLLTAYKILHSGLEQNLATWILWGILDTITAVSLWRQNGNWGLCAFYVVGALFVSSFLFYKRQWEWTKFENFIILLIVACLFVWYLLGPWFTTIAGTLSVALATTPQIKDDHKNTKPKSLVTWTGFLLVNLCYLFAAKSWAVEEILYPLTCVGLCVGLMSLNWEPSRFRHEYYEWRLVWHKLLLKHGLKQRV